MYEQASERWSPVQSVEKVILSVISMLAGERARTFNSMTFTSKPCRYSSHHLRLHFSTSLIPPPYCDTFLGTRFDAPPSICILLSYLPSPYYSSLVFPHRTSPLPLLIFDALYTILIHPVLRHTNPEPNLESGANIDCCKLYRDNKAVSITSALLASYSRPVPRAPSLF